MPREGRLNGDPGATIVFTFTDAGAPGTADTAEITIYYDARSVNQEQVKLMVNHNTDYDFEDNGE